MTKGKPATSTPPAGSVLLPALGLVAITLAPHHGLVATLNDPLTPLPAVRAAVHNAAGQPAPQHTGGPEGLHSTAEPALPGVPGELPPPFTHTHSAAVAIPPAPEAVAAVVAQLARTSLLRVEAARGPQRALIWSAERLRAAGWAAVLGDLTHLTHTGYQALWQQEQSFWTFEQRGGMNTGCLDGHHCTWFGKLLITCQLIVATWKL